MLLVIENLEKKFAARPVFSGLNAAVGAGECLVVTGPNGSGKSTLLAILAGLLRPTRGRVVLRNGDAELLGDARRDAIGLVAPDLNLYPELTALENLRFFGQLRGLESSDTDLESRLARVGLEGRGHQPVGEYSSGMRVRLKYAFALLHAPPTLLLDEPTANLDVTGVELVKGIIRQQVSHGLLVLATNDPAETRFGTRRIELG